MTPINVLVTVTANKSFEEQSLAIVIKSKLIYFNSGIIILK